MTGLSTNAVYTSTAVTPTIWVVLYINIKVPPKLVQHGTLLKRTLQGTPI